MEEPFGVFVEAAVVPGQDERTEKCPKHGDFIARRFASRFWSTCPACDEEHDQRLRLRQEEERQRKHAERIERLVQDANIPVRFTGKTLDNFTAETDGQRRVLEAARNYVEEFPRNLAVGRSMLWCGLVGTGKTHLACGILDALARAGHGVHYITSAGVIRYLRETWRRDSAMTEEEAIESLAKFALLVVDEVGLSFGTDSEQLQLFEVFNARYNAVRPTLVLSNLDRDGLKEHLGDRVLDRLRENSGTVLIFAGESWRKKVQ